MGRMVKVRNVEKVYSKQEKFVTENFITNEIARRDFYQLICYCLGLNRKVLPEIIFLEEMTIKIHGTPECNLNH